MAFYDFDMIISRRSDTESYGLRRDQKRLPSGFFCSVTDMGDHWVRTTQWGSAPSRRYAPFYYKPADREAVLASVLESGIAWARRRERADAREGNIYAKRFA